MTYRLFRWISGVMLHWFYCDIRIDGMENIPAGPMLVVVNHPNALVDSLIAAWVVPRRLRMTAKATLLNNPVVAFLFRLVGVVPLSRAGDEPGATGPDRLRNRGSFDKIIEVLSRGGSVLIFPEGRSNGDSLMPLKTGLARIALESRAVGVRGLTILPIGLNFEDKSAPGSRVIAKIESPIRMDSWEGDSAKALTEAVASRLTEASAHVEFPRTCGVSDGSPKSLPVKLARWWGRTTHDIPIRYARQIAVSRSTSADESAMLTMLFGVALVLASYAIHILVVGLITHSLLVSLIYLSTLVTGAYWTAFAGHDQRRATSSSRASLSQPRHRRRAERPAKQPLPSRSAQVL